MQTKRTPEMVKDILARMSNGETLTSACKLHDITTSAWRTWCRDDADLDIAHAHARDEGFDKIAEDCLAIADETAFDTKIGKDGATSADSEWISRSKLRVETRLKLLAKWDPKRYGDKVQQEITGADGGPLVVLSGVPRANG